MPHTLKAGKTELTISSERLIRRAEQMFRWSPEWRHHAVEAATKRLHRKHTRKADAATVLAVRSTDLHRDRERLGEAMAIAMDHAEGDR